MKQYIGYPLERARYSILTSCITELLRKGLVTAHREHGDDEKYDGYLMAHRRIQALSCDEDHDQAMVRESLSPIPFSSPFRPKEQKPRKQESDPRMECSKVLLDLVRDLEGFSGRSLLSLSISTFPTAGCR